MSSQPDRFTLPGFGLPLNFSPGEQKLFRNALNADDLADGGVQYIFDEAIAAKWRAEALATSAERDISEAMIDYCIAELRYNANQPDPTAIVTVYNGDVVKSDIAVPSTLQSALEAAVKPLEVVSSREKDWHPGSDEKVLDLVHPSLFPLIYGRSRILPHSLVGLDDCIKRTAEGVVIPIPPEEEAWVESSPTYGTDEENEPKKPFSRRFQWLPCEVDLSSESEGAQITSYINNLHPERHRDLYDVLEQLITCVIPLWNRALTPLASRSSLQPLRIEYTGCTYDPDPEYDAPETEGPQQVDFANEDDWYDARDQWYKNTRRVVQPEPGVFQPPAKKPEDEAKVVDLWKDYRQRGLQVVVKLANIHLSPEQPEYGGGTWHVEGKLNEHICASAIYYYSISNITSSRLAFRQQSDTDTIDISYEQDHHDWLPAVFGCENKGVQEVGSVDTRQGRVIAWPNILQHRVQPFKLSDPSKPGHRKIVALFLVDPGIKVVSTANVPCQQKEWWAEKVVAERKHANAIAELPLELREQIFGDVDDFPIGLDEAKELRLELMEERKRWVVTHGEEFEQHEFSLCEH
ncbi:hypothetical protein DXG03_005918 [Asterophora parasitica]|uniref:DUF4246 domain-containing protein n=1 Tax=Asterophora parasitica TaxID=117018 RepID=A0A9P7KCE6_9AGAR|nr:hypothetical protein DXG03_005918 [Asterophora parasitica]